MLERHVLNYNEAVRTSDFSTFVSLYADNAVMTFDDLPIGPFHGRPAIVEAYATLPPNDTMLLIDMQEIGHDSVSATFEWDAGGTGEMFLRWHRQKLVEHRIKTLNDVDLGD
jgi:ketosteroid isomerase-like protein